MIVQELQCWLGCIKLLVISHICILEIGCDLSKIGIDFDCTNIVDLLKKGFSSWKSICLYEKRSCSAPIALQFCSANLQWRLVNNKNRAKTPELSHYSAKFLNHFACREGIHRGGPLTSQHKKMKLTVRYIRNGTRRWIPNVTLQLYSVDFNYHSR